jgi:hypothetical protein
MFFLFSICDPIVSKVYKQGDSKGGASEEADAHEDL